MSWAGRSPCPGRRGSRSTSRPSPTGSTPKGGRGEGPWDPSVLTPGTCHPWGSETPQICSPGALSPLMLPPLPSPQGIPLREAARIPQRYFFSPVSPEIKPSFWLPNPVPAPCRARSGVPGLQPAISRCQPAATRWRWPPSTPHPGGTRWTGWARTGPGRPNGQRWPLPGTPGRPNRAPRLPGWSWTWAPAGTSQVSAAVGPRPRAALTAVLPASLTDPLPKKKTAQSSHTPHHNTQEGLGSLCHGDTGANWDADSTNPLAPVFPSPPPSIRSRFRDEQVNIMLLHLVPAGAFCSAGACRKRGLCAAAAGDRGEENGDIVQPEAGGGRNAGLAAGAGGYRLLGAERGVWRSNLPPKPPARAGGGSLGGGDMSSPPGPLPAGSRVSQRWGYSGWDSSAPCSGARGSPPSPAPPD